MKQPTTLKVSAFLLFIFVSSLSYGQSIFSNPITGTNPNDDNPYTSDQIVDANITVSGISRSTGITGADEDDRYKAKSWSLFYDFEDKDYFEFTITPNTYHEIDFTSFEFTMQSSLITGPTDYVLRSSLDSYTADITGSLTLISLGGTNTSTADLSSAIYQNITTPITFRIYAWGAVNFPSSGTLSINDFSFNGTVSRFTTTWTSGAWTNGVPNIGTHAIIDDDYNTSAGGIQSSFSAYSLTVNSGYTLTVEDDNYIEVQGDVTVNGNIILAPYADFVQVDDLGIVDGDVLTTPSKIKVEKKTPPMNFWYEYTYWSSPVSGETIGGGLFESDSNRVFSFDASNFNDLLAETGNNNILVSGQDDIDDEGDDWQWVNGSTFMQAGVGYAATYSQDYFIVPPMATLPVQFNFIFEGPFNNGEITVPVVRNNTTTADFNWNLIGNPYPSAISTQDFLDLNAYDLSTNPTGLLEGAIYLWSQNTAPSSSANGNEGYNFSTADYAVMNGTGGTKGGDADRNTDKLIDLNDDVIPYIASGQGFFVRFSDDQGLSTGNVVFNNAMRRKGVANSNLLYKNATTKNKSNTITDNKLWLNLTTENGAYNQILVGYNENATDLDDGAYYDADIIIAPNTYISLYSTIQNSNKKFVIQGKSTNSLSEDDTIKIGFLNNINVATLYTLSIAQVAGEFLSNNTIYLKDNLLNKLHNLSESDYTFTSETGEYNNRFEIGFNANALSTNTVHSNENRLSIIEFDDDFVQFNASNNLKIKTVEIFNLLGRQIYNFKGQNSSETYKLSKLNNMVYIAKVTLSNDAVITKKTVKE